MFSLTTPFQHCTGSPNVLREKKKRNKRYTDREEKIKLSLFTDNMTFYAENPKDWTKNLLKLVSYNGKVVRSKVIQKYTSQSLSYILPMNKCNLKFKTIPFRLALPKWNSLV